MVIVPFLSACFYHQLGLCLSKGSPQLPSNRSYLFIHTFGRGLSHGGLCAPKGGEVKVNWEPRPLPEHYIMWTVTGHSRAGGIVGVHYFSQVPWPVSFFVFAQLPSHSHYSLVWSLHQPISLWVVGHGLQLLPAKDLAQYVDYTSHEAPRWSLCW